MADEEIRKPEEVNPAETSEADTGAEAKGLQSEEPTESDEAGDQGEAAVNTDGKKYYTDEELKTLDFTKLDTSRIPPSLQAAYKSMQAGYTKKSQSLAEQRKEIERLKEQSREQLAKSQDPMERIFNDYLSDPQRILGDINTEIRNLKNQDPYHPSIEKLQELKETLIVRGQTHRDSEIKFQSILDNSESLLYSEIPDAEDKLPILSDFASKQGFSRDELSMLTNPLTFIVMKDGNGREQRIPLGETAIRLVSLINKFHDTVNPKAKEKKPEPTRIARPTSASPQPASANKKLLDLKSRAEKEGTVEAMAAYLEAKKLSEDN